MPEIIDEGFTIIKAEAGTAIPFAAEDNNVQEDIPCVADAKAYKILDEALADMPRYENLYTANIKAQEVEIIIKIVQKFDCRPKYHVGQHVSITDAAYGWGAFSSDDAQGVVYNMRLMYSVDDSSLRGGIKYYWVYLVRMDKNSTTLLFIAHEDDLSLDDADDVGEIPNDMSKHAREMLNFYLSMRRKTKNFMRSTLSNNISTIVDYENKVKLLRKDNEHLTQMLDAPLTKMKDVQKDGAELAKILENCYDDMYLDERKGILYARTKVVKARYGGMVYNLGAFDVEFDWRKLPVFKLADGYVSPVKRYMHPHIDSHGKACFGDFVSTLNEALKQRRYLYVMQLTWEFLHALDPTNDYSTPWNWLSTEDKEKVCSDCCELYDNCQCHTCEHCGEHEDDCQCFRCPDSSDYLRHGPDDSYCDGCGSYQDGGCNY